MRVAYLQGEDPSPAKKEKRLSRKQEIEAIKLKILAKHNSKFNSKKDLK